MANPTLDIQLNRIPGDLDELDSAQNYFKGYDCIKNIPLYWGNDGVKVKSKLSKFSSAILKNWVVQAFLMLLTIFALFGEDIRLLATEKSADDYFFAIALVCFIFFAVEILLSSLSKDKYLNSFFFWLDILATFTLILDVGWIWDFATGENHSQDSEDVQKSHISLNELEEITGPRNIRFMRIFRVVRLVRIVKIYKLAVERDLQKNEKKGDQRIEIRFRGDDAPIFVEVLDERSQNRDIDFDNWEDQVSHSSSLFSMRSMSSDGHPIDPQSTGLNFDIPPNMVVINNEARKKNENNDPKPDPEAKLGNRLTDVIMNRVIMLVIGAVFVFPMFYPSLYLNDYKFLEFGLQCIYDVIHEHQEFDIAWNSYVDAYRDLDDPLIYLQAKNKKLWKGGVNLDELRLCEVLIFTVDKMDPDYYYWMVAVFNMKSTSKMEAWMSMVRTAFICFMIGIASVLLTKGTKDILLKPLEKMTDRIQKMSKDPILAVQYEEYESYQRDLLSHKNKKKQNVAEEIKLLENAISKIGALLSAGFGEIGAEIIACNMRSNGGEINPLIPGRRCFCIFGVLSIKSLQEISYDLKEDTVQLINKISHIAHHVASKYSGFASKIYGEKLVIVWKFPDECIDLDVFSNAKVGLNDNFYVKEIADMAIVCFAKVLAELMKNRINLNNGYSKEIISESCNKIGIGLHQGWGLEGTIGSDLKIDPIYLSPNLDFAIKLADLSNMNDAPILISEDMYKICSKITKTKLRKLDKVMITEEKQIDIYGCNLDLSRINSIKSELENSEKNRVLNRIAREKLRESSKSGDFKISKLWEEDEDLRNMKQSAEQ
ncbi:unnamed protein product [Blepharisma stoltei]|uniref:Ion transport domain-containing protein n=1 Tax=Blepharisma stoltei TaxID=1481888 RepID=A0AAU9IQB3_9CILI|nr:unnamed protein product [Blepharisma stoltei]